jgi:hypothetical protein
MAKPVIGSKKPAKVPPHTIVEALTIIHDDGHSDQFMEAAEARPERL